MEKSSRHQPLTGDVGGGGGEDIILAKNVLVNTPYFFFQSSLEQLEEQVVISIIGTIIVQSEYDILNELCGLARWNSKDESGQIMWLGL